jgi:hypothetical protein
MPGLVNREEIARPTATTEGIAGGGGDTPGQAVDLVRLWSEKGARRSTSQILAVDGQISRIGMTEQPGG